MTSKDYKDKKKSPSTACEDLASMLGISDDEYDDFKEALKAALEELESDSD